MNKQMLWDLFMHTGKIEYYIKYKNWDELNERNTSRKEI